MQRSVKEGRTVYLKSTGETFNCSILDIVCLQSVLSLHVGGSWHLYCLISAFYMADYLNHLSLADFKKCLVLQAFIKVSGGRTITCYTREHAVIYHILKLITATEKMARIRLGLKSPAIINRMTHQNSKKKERKGLTHLHRSCAFFHFYVCSCYISISFSSSVFILTV